jgi:hypothetical protein
MVGNFSNATLMADYAAANAAGGPPLPASLVSQETVDPSVTVQAFSVGIDWIFISPGAAPYTTLNTITVTTSGDGTLKGISSLVRLEYNKFVGTWIGAVGAYIPRNTPGWNSIVIANPTQRYLLSYGKCIANNTQPGPLRGFQPLATDLMATVYYDGTGSNRQDVFTVDIRQEVLVTGQAPLVAPFYLQCDLSVDAAPSTAFPIPLLGSPLRRRPNHVKR